MSGVCSAHIDKDPTCPACCCDVELIPAFQEAHKQAEAAGLHICKGCGFEYYKTVKRCPKCLKLRKQ